MKNKFIKSVISTVLATTLLFGATACSRGASTDGQTNQTIVNSGTVGEVSLGKRASYYGTHQTSVSDTNNYLVQNGACDYVVVLPQGAQTALIDAKNDLLILFKKATGVTLSVKYDNSVVAFDTTQKYISLGATSLVELAGIEESEYSEEKLKTQGIRIITKDNTVFLLGGSDFGVVNAVYKFLEVYFNFDYYYRDCIDLDQNVVNCKFKNIDITDVPDIDHFYGADYVFQWGRGTTAPLDSLALGAETYEEEISYIRYRAGCPVSVNELFLPIHRELSTTSPSETIHNALNYVTVKDEDFYSSGGGQLCFTAHGNADKLEQMVEMCAEKIIFTLKNYTPDKYPYKNYVTFTMEDNSDICHCDACKAEYAEIGYSGNLIKFSNKIGEKVDEWLNAQKDENAEFHNAYREKFKILVYGYNIYTKPPVDESGEPISEYVICNNRIGVWHVSSRGVSAHADVYDPKWPGAYEQVEGWKKITENSCLWFWHNSGNVVNNDLFSDGFTIYSNNFMELMAYGGYEYVYAAHFLNGGSDLTAWQNLLIYVQNKIRWDCHRNMDEYVKKYMKAMYQDAADVMYDLLQDERYYYQQLVSDPETKENNNWGREMKTEEKYPYAVLKGWLDKCDSAIVEIETLKEIDHDLYTLVEHRIEIEASAHLFRILNMYGNKVIKPFSDTQLAIYKARINNIGKMTPGLKILGSSLADL